MDSMSAQVDDRFGEVTVRIDSEGGLVEVRGPSLPPARLRRGVDGRVDRYSRIGSRDRAHLTLRVGDAEAVIAPAPGGVTRRSYRVDARVHSVAYRLVPNGPSTSALRRDRAQIGTLVADEDGGVTAIWATSPTVRPTDAAVGYLLAAAFGTGAPPGWEVVLHGLLALAGGGG